MKAANKLYITRFLRVFEDQSVSILLELDVHRVTSVRHLVSGLDRLLLVLCERGTDLVDGSVYGSALGSADGPG